MPLRRRRCRCPVDEEQPPVRTGAERAVLAGGLEGRANAPAVVAAPAEKASRLERTAFGKPGEIRRLSFDGAESLLRCGIQPGNAPVERARVGVSRSPESSRDRCRLHHPAGVHHGHAVRVGRDEPEVVADEDHAHPEVRLELRQQLEDLGLDGDVEGGGGLVRDEHLRTERDGHGDEHPLAHAPGELMGVSIDPLARVRDVHPLEQLDGTRPRVRPPDGAVRPDDRRQLVPHREHGIERGEGVLEHHRDLRSAHRAHGGGAEARQIPTAEPHLPARDPAAGGRRPSTERKVMVLPEPDSPTTASVSPRLTSRPTPSTTVISPASPGNTVRSPRTCSTGSAAEPGRSGLPASISGAAASVPGTGLSPVLRPRAFTASGCSRNGASAGPGCRGARRRAG